MRIKLFLLAGTDKNAYLSRSLTVRQIKNNYQAYFYYENHPN